MGWRNQTGRGRSTVRLTTSTRSARTVSRSTASRSRAVNAAMVASASYLVPVNRRSTIAEPPRTTGEPQPRQAWSGNTDRGRQRQHLGQSARPSRRRPRSAAGDDGGHRAADHPIDLLCFDTSQDRHTPTNRKCRDADDHADIGQPCGDSPNDTVTATTRTDTPLSIHFSCNRHRRPPIRGRLAGEPRKSAAREEGEEHKCDRGRGPESTTARDLRSDYVNVVPDDGADRDDQTAGHTLPSAKAVQPAPPRRRQPTVREQQDARPEENGAGTQASCSRSAAEPNGKLP